VIKWMIALREDELTKKGNGLAKNTLPLRLPERRTRQKWCHYWRNS
jgi:hypothetical protein